MSTQGGYDDGYAMCDCFWGREPGSLVREVASAASSLEHKSILDAGCGEGKNAYHLASLGARVDALDISELAIRNARAAWPAMSNLEYRCADIRLERLRKRYDVVVAYGLLHCLSSADEIVSVVAKLKDATEPGGLHIVCAFNSRHQDLSAHPNFWPTLLDHGHLVTLYSDWNVEHATDTDLHEQHPNNMIPHIHSLTRMIVRRLR